MTQHPQQLREWLPLFPLLLLLAATYWLNQQVQPLPPKPGHRNLQDPDFIISNISATTIDAHGAPHFTLAARKVAHYPEDDSTVLDEPHLTSLSPGQPPVYTSAKQGEISSQGDEIFLRDEVKLVRSASPTQSELSFTTDYLHVLPDDNLADTNRPVTLVDKHNSVHATGMQFNNQTRVIKLLSQVRSEHETAKK
jgi:lipopolysaccharide export system protein LptC